jgi:sarcosine oxidase subunit alpha
MPTPITISLSINGAAREVEPGTTVAAAILLAGHASRISATGERRAPVCGMGICFECRAVVNGVAHRRTCQILCEPGMTVETDQ